MRRLTTRRNTAGLVIAIASLGVAGCGGSSATSSSSAHTAAGTQSSGATSSSGSASTATSTSTTTSGGSSTTAATAAGSPTQTSGAASSTAAQSAARVPDTDVRLPASFTIGAHGVLQPPLIAAPKHTDIELTVRSGDSRVHTFMLRTSPAVRLTVSGGRPARTLLKGIAVGTYTVDIDGAPRGKLIIGAAPGP